MSLAEGSFMSLNKDLGEVVAPVVPALPIGGCHWS
jgi:hypothetical protein